MTVAYFQKESGHMGEERRALRSIMGALGEQTVGEKAEHPGRHEGEPGEFLILKALLFNKSSRVQSCKC